MVVYVYEASVPELDIFMYSPIGYIDPKLYKIPWESFRFKLYKWYHATITEADDAVTVLIRGRKPRVFQI